MSEKPNLLLAGSNELSQGPIPQTNSSPVGPHHGITKGSSEQTGALVCREAALSRVNALSSRVWRLSAPQFKSVLLETLGTMLENANGLSEICDQNKWHVAARFSQILTKLITCFREDRSRINMSSTKTAALALDFLRTVIITDSHSSLQTQIPLYILVVDDDTLSRRALTRSLTGNDLIVTDCVSPEDALCKLRRCSYDLVFCDILMPDMDGFDLLKLVRKLPGHDDTPFVFVTSLADFKTRAASINIGGCDFIAKPVFPTEILLKTFTYGLGACRKNTRPNAAETAGRISEPAQHNVPATENTNPSQPAASSAATKKALATTINGHSEVLPATTNLEITRLQKELQEITAQLAEATNNCASLKQEIANAEANSQPPPSQSPQSPCTPQLAAAPLPLPVPELRARLERELREAENHRLIQSILCEQIRTLDSKFSN